MLAYKAKLVGITVIRVNEAYTSQQCSFCGYVDKRNRKSRGRFVCRACGVLFNADLNAARNILQRYLITQKVVPRGASSSQKLPLPDSGCVTHPVQNLLTQVA